MVYGPYPNIFTALVNEKRRFLNVIERKHIFGTHEINFRITPETFYYYRFMNK